MAEIAILTSDKVDLKLTLVKQDKEQHFVLIKGAIQQKEITIIKKAFDKIQHHFMIKA
jgi:ribosomal protein L3